MWCFLSWKIYRSGSSNLPPRGKIGAISVQSMLLYLGTSSTLLRSGVVCDGTMTKTFAGLLQILAIQWAPEHFVEVGAGIETADYIHSNVITKG